MNKKYLPVRSVCRNCGAELMGRYCCVCGQDVFAGTNRKLREVVAGSMDVVFAWDNKVWRSLLYLVAFPGRLTREYLDGRIVRYVHPSKLFWFLSILFFALLVGVSIPPRTNVEPQAETEIQAQAQAEIQAEAETETEPQAQFEIRTDAQTRPLIDNETMFENSELIDIFSSWAPYLMLLLIPLFAALVWMFFYKRDYYYADYLIFALHFHAFLFLLFSLWIVIRWVFPEFDHSLWFVFIIPMTYLGVALGRVYGARVVPMIFKILLLALLYFAVMLALAVGFILLYAAIFKDVTL